MEFLCRHTHKSKNVITSFSFITFFSSSQTKTLIIVLKMILRQRIPVKHPTIRSLGIIMIFWLDLHSVDPDSSVFNQINCHIPFNISKCPLSKRTPNGIRLSRALGWMRILILADVKFIWYIIYFLKEYFPGISNSLVIHVLSINKQKTVQIHRATKTKS